MNVITENLIMRQQKNKSSLQITLDDDFNVPDRKPDIEKIVKEKGSIIIQEITPVNDRIVVKGNLEFDLLYLCHDERKPLQSMQGSIPFEENINMDGVMQDTIFWYQTLLEDMAVSMINSRKISIRALLNMEFFAEMTEEGQAVTDIYESDIQYENIPFSLTCMTLAKKDTHRIKEAIALPMGKDNIDEILYWEMNLLEKEIRMYTDRINLRGLMKVFLLYVGDNEENTLSFHEAEIPINEDISCPGCHEDMIPDVFVTIHNKDLTIRPDEDGEERILDLEMVLELTIRGYEEEHFDVIRDAYSTKSHLKLEKNDTICRRLVLKNASKFRVADTMSVPEGQGKILSLGCGTGTIKIDSENVMDEGILVDGVINVEILYITEEDKQPIGAINGSIPFSHMIEVRDMPVNPVYEIKPDLDQLLLTLVSEREVEIKAALCLDAIIFNEEKRTVILDIAEADSLEEERSHQAGITGYFAKPEDTLWSIAKEFHITKEELKEQNHLENDTIEMGQKLIICK